MRWILDTVTDKVVSALRKIRCHIGVPTKFNKAARLVLSLCHEGHITTASSSLFFEVRMLLAPMWVEKVMEMEVLMIAMMDKNASLATEHRKGYCKLITEGVKVASLFTPLQRKMFEVYQIWTTYRSELNTDDSFLFGKNMSRLRVCDPIADSCYWMSCWCRNWPCNCLPVQRLTMPLCLDGSKKW